MFFHNERGGRKYVLSVVLVCARLDGHFVGKMDKILGLGMFRFID